MSTKSHFTYRSTMTILSGMKRFDLELRVLLALVVVNGVAEASIVPLLPSIRDDLGMTAAAGRSRPLRDDARHARRRDARRGRGEPVRNARAPRRSRPVLIPLALVGQALADSLPAPARRAPSLRPQLRDHLGDRPRTRGGGRARGKRDGADDRRIRPRVARRPGRRRRRRRRRGLARRARSSLAVVALPLIPLIARYAEPRRDGREAREPALRGGARPRPPTIARSRARRSSAPCSASSAGSRGCCCRSRFAGNGLSAGRHRARLRSLGRRLDRGCDARRPAARLGRASSAASASPSPSSPAPGCFRPSASRRSPCSRSSSSRPAAARRSTRSTYAVGVRASSGDSAPAVIGVMNLAWAVMALSTPLLAGLADGSAGVRVAFAAHGTGRRRRRRRLCSHRRGRPCPRLPDAAEPGRGSVLPESPGRGYTSDPLGPLAQLVEQGTLNPKVEGSNPSRPIFFRESP